MARVRTLKPSVQPIGQRLKPSRTTERRMTGSALQRMRFAMWKEAPNCVNCGKLTQHPYGYEIDHIVSLDKGGDDAAHNRQLLCLDCHAAKTAEERNDRGGMF